MLETLTDIGEFELIHQINELLQKEGVRTPGVTLGIGDDTATFLPHAGYELLVTCDCMVEGRHYLPDHTTLRDLGRRAMALNISDIGAMGGQPLYALVSLGLRANTLAADMEAMYRGFLVELNPFGASVIGGNLTRSGDGMFIDITMIGEGEKGKIVRRSTAKAGDKILITGYPGRAAAGLQLLMHSQPLDSLRDHPLVRAYNTPSHRAQEGQALARSGFATAMIDTSDGFLGDLVHICRESGVGATLIQEKIPISEDLRQAALKLGQNPYDLVLQESDDYELIITCSPDHVAQIRSTVVELGNVPITEVGGITDACGGIELKLPNGTQRTITTAGWDHFTPPGGRKIKG